MGALRTFGGFIKGGVTKVLAAFGLVSAGAVAGGGAAIGGYTVLTNPELKDKIVDKATDILTPDGEEKKKPEGFGETVSGFFSNLKFGAGSLIGAGALALTGLYLQDPLITVGLAGIGALAGQPIMNAIIGNKKPEANVSSEPVVRPKREKLTAPPIEPNVEVSVQKDLPPVAKREPAKGSSVSV